MNAGAPLFIALLIFIAPLSPQALAAPQPKFEVASVKPSGLPDFRNASLETLPGGKLAVRNVSLIALIATAYDIPFQSPRLSVESKYAKLLDERYDVTAQAAPNVPRGRDQMRLMLQSLLTERFGLKIRREIKELPVYELTIARGGPKLEPSKLHQTDCEQNPSACHQLAGGQGRGLHGVAVDIADIVLFVQNWSDRPVIDKTALTGLYKVDSEGWIPMRQMVPDPNGNLSPEQTGMADSGRPTLFDIFTRLGLHLERGRGPVEMLTIENVERAGEDRNLF